MQLHCCAYISFSFPHLVPLGPPSPPAFLPKGKEACCTVPEFRNAFFCILALYAKKIRPPSEDRRPGSSLGKNPFFPFPSEPPGFLSSLAPPRSAQVDRLVVSSVHIALLLCRVHGGGDPIRVKFKSPLCDAAAAAEEEERRPHCCSGAFEPTRLLIMARAARRKATNGGGRKSSSTAGKGKAKTSKVGCVGLRFRRARST